MESGTKYYISFYQVLSTIPIYIIYNAHYNVVIGWILTISGYKDALLGHLCGHCAALSQTADNCPLKFLLIVGEALIFTGSSKSWPRAPRVLIKVSISPHSFEIRMSFYIWRCILKFTNRKEPSGKQAMSWLWWSKCWTSIWSFSKSPRADLASVLSSSSLAKICLFLILLARQ